MDKLICDFCGNGLARDCITVQLQKTRSTRIASKPAPTKATRHA